MTAFDPRVTPARPDLAARHLEGAVTASRYVEGRICEVIEPLAPVRRAPLLDALLDTEALMGERVMVYETTEEGWAWGGLDCSGLVQVALTACGIPCPRDSDMQEQALGTPIAANPAYSNL